MKLRIFVCTSSRDPRCNRKPTTAVTKAPTTLLTTTLQSTIPSTTTSSTSTFQATNSTTTNALTEEITLSTSTTSNSESSTRRITWQTKATEEPVMTTDSDVVGLPVNAKLRNPIKPVSKLNWTIMIPLMACLLLSIMVNIIFFCRLRKRKQGYDLDEKNAKILEANSVRHQEKDRIEPQLERTWLLCRLSADVTDV